jgi:hypothetical protein
LEPAPARAAAEPEGHRGPRNEPGRPAGGDPIAPDGSPGSGRSADGRVAAMTCALVILLAARLSAAFAGRIGGSSITPANQDVTDQPDARARVRASSPSLARGAGRGIVRTFVAGAIQLKSPSWSSARTSSRSGQSAPSIRRNPNPTQDKTETSLSQTSFSG